MLKYFLLLSFFVTGLSVQAAPACLELFKRESAVEILTTINEKYSQTIFNTAIDENIQSSSALLRSYKLFKLKRMFNNLEKNANGFDNFELASFVYKLDKLAFADAVDSNLTFTEKNILSEARRSLLNEGLTKHFGLSDQKSGFFKKFGYYFSQSISWKYWRWSTAWVGMPKLVGTSIPPELAHLILLEGLDAHRAEVEKYLPQINNRKFFNIFSRVYNVALITSLFTVVPYLTHDYYQEQMKLGQQNALQIFAPLLTTTKEMAQVDQLMQKEVGALEKYITLYTVKNGQEPSPEHIEAAKKAIKAKLASH